MPEWMGLISISNPSGNRRAWCQRVAQARPAAGEKFALQARPERARGSRNAIPVRLRPNHRCSLEFQSDTHRGLRNVPRFGGQPGCYGEMLALILCRHLGGRDRHSIKRQHCIWVRSSAGVRGLRIRNGQPADVRLEALGGSECGRSFHCYWPIRTSCPQEQSCARCGCVQDNVRVIK